MTLPILTDDPTSITDPPDGLLHISVTPLSDAAYAVAVSVGAVLTAMCGYRRTAQPADPHTTPVCRECDVLARATELEVR